MRFKPLELCVVTNYSEMLVGSNFDFIFPGRVCVPIDPQNCEEFDPTSVPTLSQVNAYLTDDLHPPCIILVCLLVKTILQLF